MSQNDFVIANQTAPAFRADLNSALQALASVSSGSTEPATKYANMLWYDAGTNTLKKRNEANSAWINMGTFDEGTGTFTPTGTPPVQTQTTWDTGTSTTESVISPAKLKGAIDNSVGDFIADDMSAVSAGSTVVLKHMSGGGATQTIRAGASSGILSISHLLGETSFTALRDCSIRVELQHAREGGASITQYVYVYRDGILLQTWSTSSTTWTNCSLDVTLSAGQTIYLALGCKGSESTATTYSSIRNVRYSADKYSFVGI